MDLHYSQTHPAQLNSDETHCGLSLECSITVLGAQLVALGVF